MRIIDEKGKIFGKINVIDFLVILFLLLLIPMLHFSEKVLMRQNPVINKKVVMIQVKFSNVIPEIDRVLKIDDIDREGGRDRGIGKLKAILKNNPTDANSSNRDIVALFDITCEENYGTLFYKQVPVRVGSVFSFTTNLYNISGVITSVGTDDISRKKDKIVEVEVKFSNVIPELAAVLKIGDTDLKDMTTGRLKAILSDKVPEVLELKLSSSKQNGLVIFTRPLNRDIVALFDITCEENYGTLFYKQVPVRVGSVFSFTTNLYNISGVVTGIKNK